MTVREPAVAGPGDANLRHISVDWSTLLASRPAVLIDQEAAGR